MSAEARVTLAIAKAHMNVAAVITNQHTVDMQLTCPWTTIIQLAVHGNSRFKNQHPATD